MKNQIIKIPILLLYLLFIAFALKFYHKIYFISATLIILASLGLSFIFITRQHVFNKNNINIYIVFTIIISLQLFSYFWTNSLDYSVSKILYFSLWTITFVIYTNLINENHDKIIKINFFIGIFYIILIFLEYGSPLQIIASMDKFTRLGHSDDNTTNPIVIARYLGFFLITSFFIFNEKNTIWKILILILILILLLFIFLTGSKGILLSLFLLSFIFIFKMKMKYIIYVLVLLIFFISIFILFIDIDNMLKSSKLYQFIEYRFLNSNHNSYSTRENQFSFALDSFVNGNLFQQLFGYGIGNFGIAYFGIDERYYPHNIFLEILYENGLISLFLFLYIVLFMIKALIKLDLSNKYILYIVVCYYYFLFNAMVSGDIYENIPLFIFFILYNDINKRKYF